MAKQILLSSQDGTYVLNVNSIRTVETRKVQLDTANFIRGLIYFQKLPNSMIIAVIRDHNEPIRARFLRSSTFNFRARNVCYVMKINSKIITDRDDRSKIRTVGRLISIAVGFVDSQIIDKSSTFYSMPLSNIYPDGKVCLGSSDTTIKMDGENAIQRAVEKSIAIFWSGNFNRDLQGTIDYAKCNAPLGLRSYLSKVSRICSSDKLFGSGESDRFLRSACAEQYELGKIIDLTSND